MKFQITAYLRQVKNVAPATCFAKAARCVCLVLFLLPAIWAGAQLKQVALNGAVFHYIDTGKGEPVVFVHGGLEDYTTWLPQLERFSGQYRVIAYSRRYNYPNSNKHQPQSFSPATEAEDLAALITTLQLGKVHLVGHSYGGLVALTLADKQPHLLRTLTLSEPATLNWLPALEGGQALLDDFNSKLWAPIRTAFRDNDSLTVLRHTLMYFAGEDLVDKLPAEVISHMKRNLGEWNAIAFSPVAFEGVARTSLEKLEMPVLMLTAGETLPLLQPLNKELLALLPTATHFHFREGTHDYWATHPDVMGKAVLTFIAAHRNR